MTSVEKHLALIMEWIDRGFDKGAKKAKFDLDDLKKKARDLARDLAIVAAAATGFGLALYKMTEAGAKVVDMGETFDTVRKKAGLLPGVLNDIREATRGTVTNMNLMAASSRSLSDGLDPSRLTELWAKAKQISEVTGVEVPAAFEAMSLALAKGQTRMLTSIGITLDAEEVTQKYARAIGKETADLTFRDRQIAISMALEEKYIKQFKSLGDLGGDNAERFERMGVGFANFKDKFFGMLAGSPAVEKFLTWMLGKLDDWSASLDGLEPKIQTAVGVITNFYKAIIAFGSEKAGPAIANIWKYRDALAALAAVVGTGVVASKIMGIGVALGLVTGGTATIITGLAVALAGVAVAIDNTTKGTRDMDRAFQGFRPGMDFIPARRIEEQSTRASFALDELLAKVTAPGLVGRKIPAAGGVSDLWGGAPKSQVDFGEDWKGAALARQEMDLPEEDAMYADKLQKKTDYNARCRELVMNQSDWENEMLWLGVAQANEAMQMRMNAYQAGYAVMGQWTQKFYTHGANMGRTFNAMMIAGFGEMAAAYIESKISQYKMDVMEYSLMAIVMLARGNFGKAALYGQAAAQAALIAGAGSLAAAGIRSWTQGKAEAISSKQEVEFNAAAASGGEEQSGVAQRRQATGIVNTRPISIVVNSTTNFNSGYNIFGDSESAVNDFYNGNIRIKIEEDINSGMIQVA